MSSRNWRIWGGLLLATLIVVWFGVGELLTAEHELAASVSDLQRCESYARDIRQLKQRPRLASMGLDSPEQTIRRVSQSMLDAGIRPDSLLAVSPSEPQRIAASQYLSRSTELSLKKITLPQLADLAGLITTDADGSVVRDLVLTAGAGRKENDSNGAEFWDARMTLTQLIYSPTSQ